MTTSIDSPAVTIDTNRAGVPFGRLVGVEFRKMTDTRGGKTLVTITGGLILLAIAIMVLVQALNDGVQLTANDFAGVLQFVTLLIVPVFAIMITTSEWNQRTNLTTFTLEPRRQRIVLAKLAAVIVFAVVTLAVSVALGALGNVLAGLVSGRDEVWNIGADDLLWSLGLQVAFILSAFALGLLLLNTAAAIAVFYVSAIMLRFIVYPIVFGFVSWFFDLGPYIDLFFGFAVAQSGESLQGDAVGGLARVLPLVSSSVLWIVVPGVLGYLRATRSEVK
jgi:ABC-type transport system involved in multi-copper enzyme maturation permease subunit